MAALSAALNYWVDPYAIFRPPGEGGLPSRPAIATHERLHKEYALERVRARTLLLGNSRVLNGFNPRNPLLPQPAYNAAISGGSLFETWKSLQFALARQNPSLVLLGIDPASLFDPLLVRPGFGARSLAIDKDWTTAWSAKWEEGIQLLVSLFASKDSLSTLLAVTGPTIRYSGGMRDPASMDTDKNDVAKRRALSAKLLLSPEAGVTRQVWVPGQATALQEMVRECAQRGIRLIIFLQPAHATRLERDLKNEAYLRNRLQSVREVLAEVDVPIELWTFLGFNEITMDPVGDTGPMHYYWEVSHYREEVGNMIIERILGMENQSVNLQSNFGRRVDLADQGWVENEIRRLQTERVIWQERSRSFPKRYLP